MKTAICDDEGYWRETLADYLKAYQSEKHIDVFITFFSDGGSLLNSTETFDIIFLDYKMDKMNGIETARKIRNNSINSCIIFVSSLPDAVFESFEVGTFRYLLKPINKEKLFRSLDDFLLSKRESFLILKTQKYTLKIKESDIIFCESVNKHTILHTKEEKYEILINLKEIEKKLPKDKFFRCHKSYIVSFLHIKFHNNSEIIFDGNYPEKAYISRNYLPAFKKEFHDYIIRYNSERF